MATERHLVAVVRPPTDSAQPASRSGVPTSEALASFLRHLANRLGDRFRAGIVLYAGEQQLSFGDRLTALPMAALWTLDGSAS